MLSTLTDLATRKKGLNLLLAPIIYENDLELKSDLAGIILFLNWNIAIIIASLFAALAKAQKTAKRPPFLKASCYESIFPLYARWQLHTAFC